jgi:hypothetical protein
MEEKSLEELRLMEKDIFVTFNEVITKLIDYNKEISFFGDNIEELTKQRDKLLEDFDYIMSK